MRYAACAAKPMGMAGADARVWRSGNPSNQMAQAFGGFVSITLTHKAAVRPEGSAGEATG